MDVNHPQATAYDFGGGFKPVLTSPEKVEPAGVDVTLPVMNPTTHLPMSAHPGRQREDGTREPAHVMALDVNKTISDIRTARLKSEHFSHSCYIFAAIGLAVHFVVLFCFAFAGSVTFGGIYAVTLLLEIIVMTAVSLRASWGGLRLLGFASLMCWTFIGVVLTLAITGSVTNWMHFEETWARWLALGLTYAHVLICFGMAVCLVNVMQAKMIISLRAAQVAAARVQYSGPEIASSEELSKIKNT